MGLYIEKFLPTSSDTTRRPSVIKITLPAQGKYNTTIISGIAEGDTGFSMGNQFGPLIPDLPYLQDIFFIFNSKSFPAWISSSSQVWRGTNPIAISISMYVINWKPNLGLEKQLEALASFATLSPSTRDDGSMSFINVQAHGGYQPDLLNDNRSAFLTNGNVDLQGATDILKDTYQYGNTLNNMDDETLQDYTASMSETYDTVNSQGQKGLIRINIGNHFQLSNLLLTKLDITPSLVEVRSPRLDTKPKPLYYRIQAAFQTNKVALSTQVPYMFGGS